MKIDAPVDRPLEYFLSTKSFLNHQNIYKIPRSSKFKFVAFMATLNPKTSTPSSRESPSNIATTQQHHTTMMESGPDFHGAMMAMMVMTPHLLPSTSLRTTTTLSLLSRSPGGGARDRNHRCCHCHSLCPCLIMGNLPLAKVEAAAAVCRVPSSCSPSPSSIRPVRRRWGCLEPPSGVHT